MTDIASFFVLPLNLPFAVALSVVGLIALLEGVGLLFGVGLVGLFDSLLPDSFFDWEFEGPNTRSHGLLGRFMRWLRCKKVPMMITLIVFLTAFGAIGFMLQLASSKMSGVFLPLPLAILVSGLLSLPSTHIVNRLLVRILPNDESNAVALESLVGKVAKISLGRAKSHYPAQGKVKDHKGKTHYIMIEPEEPNAILKRGESILIVRKEKGTFYGVKDTSELFTHL